MTPPRVVIVGAGFGGMWAARTLRNEPVDVVLVDRNNYHTFFPLLYQVAAAELVPTDIAHPIRSIFRHAHNVSVRMAAMTGLDRAMKTLHTDAGPIEYDHLILGLGSESAYFGVEGAEEHAFPLRWMRDAIPLRHHVLTRFEAAQDATPEDRDRLLRFCVVGGGPTGVEYAGALAELVYGPLLRDFPWVSPDDVEIVLLEGGDRVLAGMPERLGAYAAERLRRRNVSVRFGALVERIESDRVEVRGVDPIPTDTVVWTAGIQGHPQAESWGLPVGRGGRVVVEPDLVLADDPSVSVIGDLAYLEDERGEPLPQVAQVAIQQGRKAAKNVLARARGEAATAFRYRDPGMLAVIGRNSAVAHVFGRAFRGGIAWFLWLVIHVSWLIGFRNRALVLLNWGWNYVFYRRAIRLILPTVEVEADRDP
ncbi:MAG: NAD(P)/FAD-dependent oxidoreductase [Gemmatimonadota bacterium]